MRRLRWKIRFLVRNRKPTAPLELEPIQQTPRERQSAAEHKLQEVKISVFNDLIEAVDLAQLSTLSPDAVREEISDIVSEIISMRTLVLSAQEQQQVITDICNDVLGLGPLEPLLARDDIADIMVNGPRKRLHRDRWQSRNNRRPNSATMRS